MPLRQFGPSIGGAGVYTVNVLKRLATDHRAALTIFTTESQLDPLCAMAPSAVFRLVPDQSAGLSIEHDFDGEQHDVLFCPLNLLDPPSPQIPSVVVIYDIAHELHPENFSEQTLELRRRTYRQGAEAADMVLTVSDHARRTIAERYSLDPGKIVVAPGGISEVFTQPARIEPSSAFRELQLPEEYLYYPANYWPHKNHDQLLRALQVVLRSHEGLCLVLSGAPGPDADRVWRLVRERGLERNVKMLGLVEETLVCELMRHARVVPFVSQFEGFGLPIVEAFSAGAPVVTSLAEGARETGGDAVLTAPADDPAAIAREIERILTDPQLAAELRLRGRQRAMQFSWEQTTATVAECLEQVARLRSRSPAKRVRG
ncbi:MAG: glycosyltransferase family 1 protein [Solirubrobacteraceae bacterium]